MSNVPNNVIVAAASPNTVIISQDAAGNVIVNEDVANTVIINQDAANQVVVRLGGSAGNTRRHVHTQASASALWTITHSLGGKPSVMVADTADTVVIGEVKYVNSSQITVEFTAAFSGYAYLT